MLSLGKWLELTLAGREPAQQTQMTVAGTRLRWLAAGALEVTPHPDRDSGLDLLLSAGVHGSDTAPIELLDEWVTAIASGALQPRARVLFLLGNPDAIRRGAHHLEQDIDHLFNGRHELSSGPEAMRACELERLAATFFQAPGRTRLHYDLHMTSRGSCLGPFALQPWAEGRAPSPGQWAQLAAAGVAAVVLPHAPGIAFSAYTYAALGAEAFSLVLGKARPFGHNDPVALGPLRRTLQALIEGAAPPAFEGQSALAVFSVAQALVKHSDDFRLRLPDALEHFAELPRGALLATDAGHTRWVVEHDQARIVFADAQVRDGQRAGWVVVPGERA